MGSNGLEIEEETTRFEKRQSLPIHETSRFCQVVSALFLRLVATNYPILSTYQK